MFDPVRFLMDASGDIVRARIAPREEPDALWELPLSIIFEGAHGRWIGAAPVAPGVDLQRLSRAELLLLLAQARRIG